MCVEARRTEQVLHVKEVRPINLRVSLRAVCQSSVGQSRWKTSSIVDHHSP